MPQTNTKELLELMRLKRDALLQTSKGARNALGDVSTMAGGVLNLAANIPGQDPNIGQSVLGGALSGVGGGLFGMAAGALSSGLTSLKRKEDYLRQRDNEQDALMLGKTVMPSAYMEEGGFTDFTKVQTEEGETLVLPTGEIVEVNADKAHKDEDPSKVTDIIPTGTLVFSKKHEIDLSSLSDEDDIVLTMPGTYSEEGNTEPFEWRLTDLLGDGKMSFAEASNIIKKKISTQEDIKDIFTTQANSMNIETRMPYIARLMELQEKVKGDYKEGGSYEVSEEEAAALVAQGYEFDIEE